MLRTVLKLIRYISLSIFALNSLKQTFKFSYIVKHTLEVLGVLMARESSVLGEERLATRGPILGTGGITVNHRTKGPEIADSRVCALSGASFS